MGSGKVGMCVCEGFFCDEGQKLRYLMNVCYVLDVCGIYGMKVYSEGVHRLYLYCMVWGYGLDCFLLLVSSRVCALQCVGV